MPGVLSVSLDAPLVASAATYRRRGPGRPDDQWLSAQAGAWRSGHWRISGPGRHRGPDRLGHRAARHVRRPNQGLLRLHARRHRHGAGRRQRARHACGRPDRRQRPTIGVATRAWLPTCRSSGSRSSRDGGQHEQPDCCARIRDRQQEDARHRHHQPVARPSAVRAGPPRPARAGGRQARRRPASSSCSSAGNNGINKSTGLPGFGGISSPANAPSSLTVGSSQSRGHRGAAATTPSAPGARVDRPVTTVSSSRTSSRRATRWSGSRPAQHAGRSATRRCCSAGNTVSPPSRSPARACPRRCVSGLAALVIEANRNAIPKPAHARTSIKAIFEYTSFNTAGRAAGPSTA